LYTFIISFILLQLGLATYPKSNPADIEVFIYFWDLWWKVWHLEKFFCQNFGFPLSVSFYKDMTAMYLLPIRCTVTKQFAATVNKVLIKRVAANRSWRTRNLRHMDKGAISVAGYYVDKRRVLLCEDRSLLWTSKKSKKIDSGRSPVNTFP
jgi:hypothetical protein